MGFASTPLTDLLQQEGTQLREILDEGTMLQEFRTGHQELTEYFTREDIISELCEWSMTLHNEKEDKFEHLSRLATEVLVCGGSSYSHTLINSQAFKTFCTNFLTNKGEWDSLCVGHFQKVFVHLLRQSSGQFLSSFPSIVDDLADHLTLMSVVEFVILLETEFTEFLPKPFVPIIATHISTSLDNSFTTIYALRQIISLGWSNPLIRASLESSSVVSHLVHAACASGGLASIELHRLLSRLRRESPLARDIIRQHSSEFYSGSDARTAALAMSAANVDRSASQSILMICDGGAHWALANVLVSELESLTRDDLASAFASTDAASRLSGLASSGSVSAQQLRLLEMVRAADESLLSGVPADAVIRSSMLDNKYGGEIPIGFNEEATLNAE